MSSGFASGLPDGHGDLDDCELAGYASGLSAGLAKALADLDDADLVAAARGGFAAVPLGRVRDGATVVEHRLAAAEGVAILDLRLPAGLVLLRHAGDRPEVVGLRLAAVRIGVVRRLLDHVPVSGPRTTRATAVLEGARHRLAGMARYPSRTAVADVHARLDRLDGELARMFSPDAHRAEHPMRALFVAGLVANTWAGS